MHPWSRLRTYVPWFWVAVLMLELWVSAVSNEDAPGHIDPHASSASSREGKVSDPTTNRRITKEQLEYQIDVAEYVCVAGLTLYCWEFLATLGRELKMWLRPRSLLHPQVILFLLIRYATIPSLVVTSYSLWGHFDKDDDCVEHEQLTVAVVEFVVACVFSWRTIAIWRRARWVVVFMITLTLAVTGVSIGLLYFSRDALLVTGACRPAHDPEDSPEMNSRVNTFMWFYLTSMIFDTIAVMLSTYKLCLYANMGRRIQKVVFRDPFELHRQQLEKGETEHGDNMYNMESFDPKQARRTPRLYRRLSQNVTSTVFFPVRVTNDLMTWWSSLTPLVARLLRNGMVYFVVATAYNLNNFLLEATQSLHAKSFLALYAPLMCVMCQRLLIQEFDEVWTPYDADVEYPGRQLVDRVMGPTTLSARKAPETARFDQYTRALEEHHASVVGGTFVPSLSLDRQTSPEPAHGEKADMAMHPSPPVPERSISIVSSRISPRTSAVPPQDVEAGVCTPPRPVAVSHVPQTTARATSPLATAPAVAHRLTFAQEQQALRMAGLL